MTREEFAKKWGHERTMNTMGLPVTIPKYDEFLKDLDSLSLPPAEGAEEILKILKKYEGIECYYQYDVATEEEALKNRATLNNIADELASLINQFATLHAQKIADKMVSERIGEVLDDFSEYLWKIGIAIEDEDINEYLKSREP